MRKELVAGPLCPSKTPKMDQECVGRWQKVEAMWSSEGELLVGRLVIVGGGRELCRPGNDDRVEARYA